jgi:DNA invertase Pin-like site-specific DNA recombinase
MKAVGYIRVSTTGQAVDGVSLAAQKEKIIAWCEFHGYELAGIYADEGLSGAKADRPGLTAALAAVNKGDALVVYSLSRLARSTAHTLELSERLDKVGADLVSLSEKIDTTSASGKMVFRLLAVLSEFERDLVSERTTTALQHKKRKGERTGSVPLGKQLAEDGVHLVDEPEEQAAIEAARKLREQGLSLRGIAEALEHQGMLSRTKKRFDAKQVQRMVA